MWSEVHLKDPLHFSPQSKLAGLAEIFIHPHYANDAF